MDRVVLGGKDVADDGDKELGKGFAIKEKHDSLLHGVDLGEDVVSFECQLDLVGQGWAALVKVDEESRRPLHLAKKISRSSRAGLDKEGARR